MAGNWGCELGVGSGVLHADDVGAVLLVVGARRSFHRGADALLGWTRVGSRMLEAESLLGWPGAEDKVVGIGSLLGRSGAILLTDEEANASFRGSTGVLLHCTGAALGLTLD